MSRLRFVDVDLETAPEGETSNRRLGRSGYCVHQYYFVQIDGCYLVGGKIRELNELHRKRQRQVGKVRSGRRIEIDSTGTLTACVSQSAVQ
jgi:hypothetical protein